MNRLLAQILDVCERLPEQIACVSGARSDRFADLARTIGTVTHQLRSRLP